MRGLVSVKEDSQKEILDLVFGYRETIQFPKDITEEQSSVLKSVIKNIPGLDVVDNIPYLKPPWFSFTFTLNGGKLQCVKFLDGTMWISF